MKRSMKLLSTGVAALFAMALGCQQAATKNPTPGSSTQRLVFHTQNHIFTLAPAAVSARVKEKVHGFFASGAACMDKDSDDDGVPDTEDDSDDNAHRGGTTETDGGMVSESSGHHDGADDGEEHADGGDDQGGMTGEDGGEPAPRCARCNRGPGQGGDFRFEVNGSEGKLDRGTLLAASSTELTVKGPSGLIHLLLSSATRFDDGTPMPGSEVRAEGIASRVADGWNIDVTRVKVLCPGPKTIDESEVPEGSTPVDPTADGGV